MAYDKTAYNDSDTYPFPITVENLWAFCGVADPLKNSRLAGVRAPDDKDSEPTKFLLEVSEVLCGFSGHSGREGVRESTVQSQREASRVVVKRGTRARHLSIGTGIKRLR